MCRPHFVMPCADLTIVLRSANYTPPADGATFLTQTSVQTCKRASAAVKWRSSVRMLTAAVIYPQSRQRELVLSGRN